MRQPGTSEARPEDDPPLGLPPGPPIGPPIGPPVGPPIGPPIGIAAAAADEVRPGTVVGLGTGRAAAAFCRALAERVRSGLPVRGVPTSRATERLATALGIPLATFDEADALALAVDGADEVDPHRNLIKGHGGALARERVVAAAADRFVVLVGPEKLSARLGEKRAVPVEALPFAAPPVARALRRLGAEAEVRREADGRPFVTDNGNFLVNAAFPEIPAPAELERAIREIPGVLDSGLFVGMADEVLVEAPPARPAGRPTG